MGQSTNNHAKGLGSSSALSAEEATVTFEPHCRRRGQVLVMVLLSLTMLVGLIFYVYNTGAVVNRRLDLQSAADSVAISGASWMARSMNVVAMDNVAMSRMLAASVVLDSIPLASKMALQEVTDWEACLSAQLARPMPSSKGGTLLRDGLQALQARMVKQRDILTPIDYTFNKSGFDVANDTFWAIRGRGGPPPHGNLWRAAVAADDLSQVTVDSAGMLAQTDAMNWGKANDTPASLLVPVLPILPAKRGNFDQFQYPLVGQEKVENERVTIQATGGTGGAIPDAEFPHRLGPWARLYKWRHYLSRPLRWETIPGTPGFNARGQGNVNVGGRRVGGSAMTPNTGHPDITRVLESEIYGYMTRGPYWWMMDHLDWWTNDRWHYTTSGRSFHAGQLPDTFFYKYIHDLSRIKLDKYMFPAWGAKPQQTYHEPLWITDFVEAKALMSRRPDTRVTYTMFYVVEIASSVPENDPRYLSPGTFRTNGQWPQSRWVPGWVDPTTWGVPQVANYIWNDSYTYETDGDPGIGIQPIIGPDGRREWQTAYMSAWYVFGGIDVGGDAPVRNPCNWEGGDEIPAPMLLDTADGDYDPVSLDTDQGARRKYFSYLGVARKLTNAPLWEKAFRTGVPGQMMAVAQAKVFNNRSWDLWTQDWQAQLSPVTQWEDWSGRLDAGRADLPFLDGLLSDGDIEAVHRYMTSVPPELTETYINH